MKNEAGTQNHELEERDAEATDKETLDDLEDAFVSADMAEKDDEEVPSPDGSLDEQKELDHAEPM